MKTRILFLFVFVLLVGTIVLTSAEGPRGKRSQATLPASIEGKAFMIRLSPTGKPTLQSVQTSLPVLFFAGTSKNGRYQAYTSLALYDELSPRGRRTISTKELRSAPSPHLVPSGELIVEDLYAGTRYSLSDPHQYVVSAAWSPINSNLIAFTFSSGSDYGLAVANAKTKHIQVVKAREVLPDRVAWSASGRSVQFYERDGDLSGTEEYGESVSHFHLANQRISADAIAMDGEEVTWSTQLPKLEEAKSRTSENQAFQVNLPDGTTFRGDNLLGRSHAELFSPSGQLLKSLRVDVIVGVLPEGIAFKTITPTGLRLDFLDRQGQITNLVSPLSNVSYFLPFFSAGTPSVTVTQTGSGYATKCNVFDHTGSMAYAYDMQAKAGYSYESIEAAADGTVGYLAKFVTCNSLDNGSDGTTCSDYRSTCDSSASNSGWGNVVIIQHADGTWTKYTHLRYGSVLPPSQGVSVGYGCEIAREGHTGYTIGNKNGCGDHLHFQRQTTGDRGGPSTSISFADQSNPLRCTTYVSGNTGRSCLFR